VAGTFGNLHFWSALHKWSSLVCTVFLLVICITGLPLVFHDEIGHWLKPPSRYATLPADTPGTSLDELGTKAHSLYPGQVITSVFADDDEPQVYVWMAPSFEARKADPRVAHFIRFDARTAKVLEESDPPGARRLGFMGWMLALHTDWFAGLPGELFLGMMALLFVAAIVSGAVLYGPFMKKLDFGSVRVHRGRRLKWLDLHNLLGAVTLAWAFVVGATGFMNELSTPLFRVWQHTDVKAMLRSYRNVSMPPQAGLSSMQAAFDTARRAVPGMAFTNIVFPGAEGGSPYHYLLWGHGNSNLTSRLFTPVLVDARSGALTAVVDMPWYLRMLEISRPLHFGDYGGLPLKIIWAVLDLMTIFILGSGLYLWFARRKAVNGRIARLAARDGRDLEKAAP
jgi:uncharacterized iron-regulated membrane protein